MPTTEARAADHWPVRVLVITHDPRRLPAAPVGGWWDLTAVVPAGRRDVPAGYAVEPLVPASPAHLRERVRLGATAVRTAQTALLQRAPAGWVWALKRSARLRTLVPEYDVVVQGDPATGRLLALMPEVLGEGVEVVPADRLGDVAAVWEELSRLAGRGVDDDDDDCNPGGSGPGGAAGLAARVGGWRVDGLPEALRLPEAVAAVVRGHRDSCGLLPGSEVSYALDALTYPGDPDQLSGGRARWLSAALTLGHVRTDDAAAADVDEVVSRALAAADRALDEGQGALALDRLTDALTLMFHRARHAETSRSPLVDDPARFLAPLRASATFADLLRRRRDRDARPETPQGRPPRVLVMEGAYGDFHRPVAAALDGHAEVRVRDLGRGHLRRTVLTPGTLPRLALLLASREGAPRLGQDPQAELDVRAEELLGHLRWADVVLSDWADPATVWLSHLCPRRVRLVLRVHGVDALEPWIHLIRWNRVDQVVVVSEPMRSLVQDVLAAMGVRRPVAVLPNLVPAPDRLDRPKAPGARTTLGLVGWGREVKDPLWALRLVQRNPEWRLVLVGPGFADPPAPHQAGYVREVEELLSSPDLVDRVKVWGATDDVGQPLQQVGVILSTSRRESWHLGLVEGALSRAVPVVRNWPLLAARGGPRALFPDAWVVDDLDQAEARIREVTDAGRWETEGARAREAALTLFHPERAADAYRELVLGLLRPPAG